MSLSDLSLELIGVLHIYWFGFLISLNFTSFVLPIEDGFPVELGACFPVYSSLSGEN